MSERPEACQTCRYWCRDKGEFAEIKHEGVCRRRPPNFITTQVDGVVWFMWFPVAQPDWWCGEYERAE